MSFHEVLPATRECLAGLRARLRGWASRMGLAPRQITDIVLATGEACANAIEHAYRDATFLGWLEVRAECTRDRRIQIRVRDTGRWRDEPRSAEYRGRGLALMRATMGTVEVDSGPGGTTVTMSMPYLEGWNSTLTPDRQGRRSS